MSVKEAGDRAKEMLARLGIVNPAINPEEIANQLGVVIAREKLDGNTSAMLYRKSGEAPVIGLNSTQSRKRQRFSIAHELGHLVLHPGRPLIVDHVRVNFRDDRASAGSFREEIEANAFAAELLMPKHMLERALMKFRLDTPEDEIVKALANTFEVSREAIGYRLVNLGLRSGL